MTCKPRVVYEIIVNEHRCGRRDVTMYLTKRDLDNVIRTFDKSKVNINYDVYTDEYGESRYKTMFKW